MNILVAYFSASGITKEVAQNIASVAQSMGNAVEIFEISPKVPYSRADLDWNDEQSRTSVECKDKNSRPELAKMLDISGFEAIFIGFPVWWYSAPHIIFSFLESADFSGKVIVPFCTSGGSGIDPAPRDMQKCAPKAQVLAGRRLNFGESRAIVRKWLESLNLG